MATNSYVTKDDVRELGKKIDRLEGRIIKKLNIIAEFFDQPILDHEKRIKRVETHLGLPKLAN